MPVRQTESRIPASLQASDLGEAVVAGDGKSAMVSFITSPLVIGRENIFVVFVTDAALAADVSTYHWSFTEDGNPASSQTTSVGECAYSPVSEGALAINVTLKNAANADLAGLALGQQIVPPNAELEGLITDAQNQSGPGISNLGVARELINDHNPYYQSVAPAAADADFRPFVFGFVNEGALQRSHADRKAHLSRLADSLNGVTGGFAVEAGQGAGVCGLRLALLAMVIGGPALPWTELPEAASARAAADDALNQNLAGLAENTRLDLFNCARFPKSNITQSARVIEALRDHYFSGKNFGDDMTVLSGTRATWMIRHFREGPILRNP